MYVWNIELRSEERKGIIMPKVKTHSASKKRFRISATGKVKMSHACRRHRLVSKPRKAKKAHKMPAFAADSNAARVKKMLPYV